VWPLLAQPVLDLSPIDGTNLALNRITLDWNFFSFASCDVTFRDPVWNMTVFSICKGKKYRNEILIPIKKHNLHKITV